MSLLSLQALRLAYGPKTILDGVSVTIGEGERVGVVGRNGSGKSTLLRIAANDETPDDGIVAPRRGLTVGYLPQEPRFGAERTIRSVMADAHPELSAAVEEYEALTRRLAELQGEALDTALAEQSRLHDRIEQLGGFDTAHRGEAVLDRLGVQALDRRIGALSGGELRRVALAQLLARAPDLLVLDEPTNHLDADTVAWLEEELKKHSGGVLVVTHDRYFLDRVVDRVIEIEAGQSTGYEGNYSAYLQARAERLRMRQREEARRSKLLQSELEWLRRGAPARTTKQKARIQRIEAMQGPVAGSRESEVKLEIDAAELKAHTILELHGVAARYGERTLFEKLDLIMSRGQRIGVIGPNGSGKTTLVKTVLGERKPDSGKVKLGKRMRVAFFDQLREGLDPDLSIYESLAETSDYVERLDGRSIPAVTWLENFLFERRMQRQKVSSLSGGERARLQMARIFARPANLLVLDEPTNDLDIDTLQILESALAEFPGCLLVVTHDRFFLNRVATHILHMDGEGAATLYAGNYDIYQRLRKAAEQEARAQAPAPAAAPKKERKPRPRKLTWKEERELEGIEARIEAAETAQAELEETLADPELYKHRGGEVPELGRRLEATKAEVAELYARWEFLSAVAEGNAP